MIDEVCSKDTQFQAESMMHCYMQDKSFRVVGYRAHVVGSVRYKVEAGWHSWDLDDEHSTRHLALPRVLIVSAGQDKNTRPARGAVD